MFEGNMLIAQSGGPSMVINQSLIGAVLAARKERRIGKILGAVHGIDGILKEEFIDFRKEKVSTLRLVAATPSSALGSVRHKATPADCEEVFRVLRKHQVKWFFYIGGNDTAETTHILAQAAAVAKHDLRCFHIAKTIDNDLRQNDHTPGYGSAARFVACAIRGDDLDNRALGGVKIDVVMGRDAGFLVAASALARQDPDDGPHLIYMPEVPFSLPQFLKDVEGKMKQFGRCVVAVSEGIRDAQGVPIVAKFSQEKDSHGNLQLSGTGALGDLLASEVKKLGVKRVRADTFGYLQRSFAGCVSTTDSREAFEVGTCAVKAALDGKTRSGSIAIRRKVGRQYAVEYRVVPLGSVAKVTRSMPPKFIARTGHDVTRAFLEYARPIVGPLPETARLDQLRKI